MVDGGKLDVVYREASSSCLSLCGFPCREVVVQGLPGFSSIEAAGKTESQELSSGFHYKGSALVASPCRNRFILWLQLCSYQQIRTGPIKERIHTQYA